MIERHEVEHFLTVKEVAEQLQVCRASIYLWLKQGFPQPLKFGRASRWRATELEEWIKARPKGVYGEMSSRTRRGAECSEHSAPQHTPDITGAEIGNTKDYDTKAPVLKEGLPCQDQN